MTSGFGAWSVGWSDAEVGVARAAVRKWLGGVVLSDDGAACPVVVLLENNGQPDSMWAPRIPVGETGRPDRPPLTAAEAEAFAAAWNSGMSAVYGADHGRPAVIGS